MIDDIVNNLQRIADRKCYPEDVLDGSIAQEWVDYIVDLQQENKQLKDKIEKLKDYGEKVGNRRNELYDKIDKAIEYIKSKQEDINNGGNDMSYRQLNVLLEILGGNNGKIN